MKVLERNALHYLGEEMYKNWQESLLEESLHKERHEERRRARREKRERKLMKLQRELQMRQKHEAITLRKSSTATGSSTVGREGCDTTNEASKNDNGRRNSSLDNGSHQDSPSRLSSIMAATASENPPPSHATGDRFNANSVRRPNLIPNVFFQHRSCEAFELIT